MRRGLSSLVTPVLVWTVSCASALLACDEGGAVDGAMPDTMTPAKQTTEPVKNDAKAASSSQVLSLPNIGETDFIVGPRNRDPFTPIRDVLARKQEAERIVQRDVKLKEFDIADLKLIGIITNINDPRGMVVAPDGTGFVLRRGDYVGRADFVKQGAHGETIQVNWRVARINGSGKDEERGVYFARDDPTTTKGVDVTRFLPLHTAR
ncbi:MAG: pilus assembly protein PilP [Myxococcota bacterium]|nr:pilus assembly protein PilP [Myxococcota bacterium]